MLFELSIFFFVAQSSTNVAQLFKFQNLKSAGRVRFGKTVEAASSLALNRDSDNKKASKKA